MTFRDATPDDVAAIAGLHNAAAGALTARHGPLEQLADEAEDLMAAVDLAVHRIQHQIHKYKEKIQGHR